MTFLHSGRVWVWVRGGYIYPRYPSHTRILKSGKTQTLSNRGWFERVPMDTGFVVMPTSTCICTYYSQVQKRVFTSGKKIFHMWKKATWYVHTFSQPVCIDCDKYFCTSFNPPPDVKSLFFPSNLNMCFTSLDSNP